MATAIEQRIFSVADYHRMAEVGILTEADRVELIEGRLIVISPVGSCHAACIKRLNAALSRQTSGHALGSIQDPLQLDDYSEPEPDVALLRPRDDFYATSHPTAEDVLLLIEVADTSEGYDHEEKVPLYARSNIPEVWFVSLAKKRVEVYTEPVAEIYRQVRYVLAGETLTVQQIPNVQVAAADLFG